MRLPLLPLLPLAALALSSCTTSSVPEPRRLATVSEDVGTAAGPVLQSRYFEKLWGKPDAAVYEDGSYRLRYRQAQTLNFVFIRGLKKPAPAPVDPPAWEEENPDPTGPGPGPQPHPQSWRHTDILGQSVKWYQHDGGSGADFPGYHTVDFTLTAPDGREGHYRIEVATDRDSKAAAWINKVNW